MYYLYCNNNSNSSNVTMFIHAMIIAAWRWQVQHGGRSRGYAGSAPCACQRLAMPVPACVQAAAAEGTAAPSVHTSWLWRLQEHKHHHTVPRHPLGCSTLWLSPSMWYTTRPCLCSLFRCAIKLLMFLCQQPRLPQQNRSAACLPC